MWFENTIYEAGGIKLAPYQRAFIDEFMKKPKEWPIPYEQFPLGDGQNDVEYDNIKDKEENPERGERVEKYNLKFAKDKRDARTPILVAFEIEPGVWSLNLASDPNTVVCQIDHNDKIFRTPGYENNTAATALYYAQAIFKKVYVANYDKSRSQVKISNPKDYTTTAEIVEKDFMKANFITRIDISQFFKF